MMDWECPGCHNVNFRNRARCNKCQLAAPRGREQPLHNAPVPPSQLTTLRPAAADAWMSASVSIMSLSVLCWGLCEGVLLCECQCVAQRGRFAAAAQRTGAARLCPGRGVRPRSLLAGLASHVKVYVGHGRGDPLRAGTVSSSC